MTKVERQIYNREWRVKNRDVILTARRKRYLANKKAVNKSNKVRYDAHKPQMREWRQANRFHRAIERSHHAAVEGKYVPCNATPEEIKTAFTGACFVCGETENTRRLCMDHCHVTGKFREWLCNGCNAALGHAQDLPSRLQALAEYLRCAA